VDKQLERIQKISRKVRNWNRTWIVHSKRNLWNTWWNLGWKQYWWKSTIFTFTLIHCQSKIPRKCSDHHRGIIPLDEMLRLMVNLS